MSKSDEPLIYPPPNPPWLYVSRKTAEWWIAPPRPPLLDEVVLNGVKFERLTSDIWAWMRGRAAQIVQSPRVPVETRRVLRDRMVAIKAWAVANGVLPDD